MISDDKTISSVWLIQLGGHYRLHHRFLTGGTRTPRGTPAVAKGYAKTIIIEKYLAENK